jgi:putative ABC transport system substrate-binding protein
MWRTTVGIITTLVLCVLAVPYVVEAQPPVRLYRVGFISPLPGSPEPPTLHAFRQEMRELGYVEGRTIILETRFAEGHQERFPDLVADLLRLQGDVLVVGSEVGVLAAQKATTTVPIVFAGVSDPVTPGIVTSLARPGGNITGVTFGIGGVGFGSKWVELLKEAVPGLTQVTVLANAADPQSAPLVRDIQAAARELHMTLDVLDAGNETNLERAFAAIGASGAQGIIVTNTPFFAANRAKLVQFAASKRLPAMYFFKLFVDAGGLMSYGGSLEESYRRAATYVDKILKGAKPADLPVEQPTKFELAINLQAAKRIGLTIPPTLLFQADEVIK